MTQKFGTNVYAPIVAGKDTDDDLPAAYGDELGRTIHHFATEQAKSDFTAKYKSRLFASWCVVKESSTWYEWNGSESDGTDGSWVDIDFDGMNTVPELKDEGFQSTSVQIGYSNSPVLPTDESWVVEDVDLITGGYFTAFLEPPAYVVVRYQKIQDKIITGFTIKGATVPMTKSERVLNDRTYVYFISNDLVNISGTVDFVFEFFDKDPEIPAPGIAVRNDTGDSITGVTDLQFDNALLSGTSTDAIVTSLLEIEETKTSPVVVDSKKLQIDEPLQLSESSTNVAKISINPNAYEPRNAPSYYATLNEETEAAGPTTNGERSAAIWFEDVIAPSGSLITVDEANKRIGLQQDTAQDPDIADGTPYLIFYRASFKDDAVNDGYVEITIANPVTKEPLLDINGEPIGVRKAVKAGEKCGILEVAAIRKFQALEYFELRVSETVGDDPLTMGDRTEGNSCILIQAIDKNDQTSRALLQCENDIEKFIKWTSHHIGLDYYSIEYFLKDERPLEDFAAGEGETGADGWHLYNWTPVKSGIAGGELTIENDGSNNVGFSLGNIRSAEKTKLLRGKQDDFSITLSTEFGGARIWGAKWTGTPDEYTKAIVTGMTAGNVPTLEPGWSLYTSSILCPQDSSGNLNNFTGSFPVQEDANNIATIIIPEQEQNPNKFRITSFYGQVSPPIDGYYLEGAIETGQKHLEFDDEYAEFGLRAEPTYGFRVSVRNVETPIPVGKVIDGKGIADITSSYAGETNPVGFLTFNAAGTAKIDTTVRVFPGEGIPGQGLSATVSFYWDKETSPNTWEKIQTSQVDRVVTQADPALLLPLPQFYFDAKVGSRIRLNSICNIDNGAFVESAAERAYMSQTVIKFTKIGVGSADDPFTSIYVQDEFGNDWELTAGTDGHIQTLLVGDLPENMDDHVLRTNFSGNDFNVDPSGAITLVNKPNPYMTAYMSTDLTYNTALEEKIITFDTVDSAFGVTIPSAGEFLADQEGVYFSVITLQVKETSDPTFIVWLEYKADGGVWELSPTQEMTINKM